MFLPENPTEARFHSRLGFIEATVERYNPEARVTLTLRCGKAVYRWVQETVSIESVEPFQAPDGEIGVIFAYSFSTGSSKVWRIVLLDRDRFRTAFDATSPSGYRLGLEKVDLDGDGWPELLTVAESKWHEVGETSVLDLPRSRVDVWGWDAKRRAYVLRRHCRYDQRLRPLRPRKRAKW